MGAFEARVNLSPFRSVAFSCSEALQWSQKQLGEAGLRSIQTFDLNTARAGAYGCCCPHHGTEQCDCQMVVLLVYGNSMEPATLILHGNNGQTWFSIAEGLQPKTNDVLKAAIHQALEETSTG